MILRRAMRVRRIALLALLVAAAPLAAQSRPPVEHRDIAYVTTNGVASQLDVYQQAGTTPTPVLLYFHGGAWTTGQRPAAASSFGSFLKLGFSVVSVSYRLSGVAPAPAAVQDARCAVKWVHDNAARYGFDPNRIVVHGTSAGGHLALLAAMLPARWSRDLPQCAGVPRVAAVLDYYGPADLLGASAVSHRTREWLRDGGAALGRELSPIAQVRAGHPPVLIVHGDADPTVPHEQSVRLRDALAKAGVTVRLHTVSGGQHGKFEPAQRAAIVQTVADFLREQRILPAADTP